MAESSGKEVLVFGAGLVGVLLALFLEKRGYKVTLVERRGDLRTAVVGEGRSINLAVSERGLNALRKMGLQSLIDQVGVPMYGRMMHDLQGKLSYQPYGKEGQCIYSISRLDLNKRLLSLAAEKPGISLKFHTRCVQVDYKNTQAEVETPQGTEVLGADYIFGSDGAFSAVRAGMQKQDRYDYQQFFIDHGYKELSIPPTPSGDWAMEPNALHIWPRESFMLIALPNPDKSFTCTLFFPFEGETSFETYKTGAQGVVLFKKFFPDILPLVPDLESQYEQHIVSSLVTVKCYPWVMNNTALVGDAAHAIVPFFGQGMNAGFEDVVKLDQLMDSEPHLKGALQAYQKQRKPNTDAIATLALNNFVEMRDKVADPDFLIQKKIEARFHALWPDRWIPLYTLVTFSHTPYSEALRRGDIQEGIMQKVMRMPGVEKLWSDDEFILKLWSQLVEPSLAAHGL